MKALVVLAILAGMMIIFAPAYSKTNATKTKPTATNTNAAVVETNVVTTVPETVAQETNTNTTTTMNVFIQELGFKVFLEGGGGTLVGLGLLYKLTPNFGLGIGAAYTPTEARNNGVSINIKAETVPLWLDLGALKLNMILGLQGIVFLNTGNRYIAGDLGAELQIKDFSLLTPSFHTYWYLYGQDIIPQIALQIRFNF